jgi:hypothetical protein
MDAASEIPPRHEVYRNLQSSTGPKKRIVRPASREKVQQIAAASEISRHVAGRMIG